jgi:16S rRNA processing protein RimM
LDAQKIICVARVGAPYGVRGFLKLHVLLDDPELMHHFKIFYLRFPKQDWQLFKVEFQYKGQQCLVRFAGFDQPESAGIKFTHAELGVARTALPSLPKNQYYWDDLLGLKVFNQEQQALGVIDHLLASSAHDVLVIKNDHNEELLIPYVWGHFIKAVDLTAQKMIVDWTL